MVPSKSFWPLVEVQPAVDVVSDTSGVGVLFASAGAKRGGRRSSGC